MTKQYRYFKNKITEQLAEDSLPLDTLTQYDERGYWFTLPGLSFGDRNHIGSGDIWYYDIKHGIINLSGCYQKSKDSNLYWIHGQTQYAGKVGRNTGILKFKYKIYASYSGVIPYIYSDVIEGTFNCRDGEELKQASEIFASNIMTCIHNLEKKMEQ